jgi:hypothetical protein
MSNPPPAATDFKTAIDRMRWSALKLFNAGAPSGSPSRDRVTEATAEPRSWRARGSARPPGELAFSLTRRVAASAQVIEFSYVLDVGDF